MGAELRRALAGGRGVAEDRLDVAGRLRVVGEPGQVGIRRGGQRGQRSAMEPPALERRERLLDGHARDLVAERDRVAVGAQHPGRQAGVEGIWLVGQRFEQPQLGPLRHDRDRVEQRPRRGVQPGAAGEDGVADGRREVGAAGRERLGDEEGVAAGAAVQLGVVDVRGQLRHRFG